MKDVTVVSKTIPANPRSDNYQTGSTVVRTSGGTTIITPGGGGSTDVDILKENDNRSFTDSLVMSALRACAEFISKKNDGTVTAIVDYLNGIKINGIPVTKVIQKATEAKEYLDSDVMSALRVITEIANSTEELKKIFLRKDQADGTPHTLTIGKDLKFGDFRTGISGGYIDKNGFMEMEEGVFRKRLFVPEIAYNRVTYFKGRQCISPGGGCTVKEWTDNGDGSYTIIPDLTDADGLSQFVDDILSTYFVFKSPEGKLQGFEEMKFRVTAADYTEKTFVMVPKPDTTWKPGDSMILAQTGNFTDPDRQTYTLIDTVNGNNCITFFDHANTWDVEPAQESMWLGKKKGRTVHGIPADNYSAVLQNVIMSGKIFQVDDITGEAFRVPLKKGAWIAGQSNAYYDEVTHNGSSWLCVNPAGTTAEPGTTADWLEYVSKGTDGAPGTGISSTDVEYAIYESSEMAPPTGWQTTSPTWVDGKYIWSRTKITYSDGKVTYTNPACITGGKGATGGEGKGIKTIVEQYYLSSSATTTTGGGWQTESPSWKNGWYIWTRSVITYTDNTTLTTNAICVTGSKGTDGTSITNCGDWHTGLHVPYMGITKMANRVFLCKAPAGSDNPPMWTITDKDDNRILQTQDGGKTYGYIITGELNTAEYELLVENGKDGRDGKDHEWIFKHTTENVTPSTPSTSQVDDYVPEGWRDDAIGVSETLPYEWACARTKKDGVWSAFTPAAIWAKWGFDGESVVIADFDNEMVNATLNSNGITTSAQSWVTVVTMSYGTEKLALDGITCVPSSGLTCMTNKTTGEITVAAAAGVALSDANTVNITARATKNGKQYARNLVFTVAGIRSGANGTDAVLYSIVPSVSSVKKDKNGNYSVASVSCRRIKTVGGVITDTTDGELKYSINESGETSIANNAGISSASFSQNLKFIFYVGGKVVDVETVPMLIDGGDGAKGDKGDTGGQGNDGQSIKSGGQWRTPASPIPALTIVTMGNSSWLSKVATLNPPLWVITDKNGNRILQTQDGGQSYGYILTGELNTAEWEKLTEDGMVVYLISTTSNIRVSNAGSLVPSAFKVYAKRNVGSTTLSYSDGYLAARGYSNGIWSSIAGPTRSSELTVNASAGYSTFSVRCYQSQADAAAWNDSFVAEQSVGVSYDGGTGRTGSEPRPRGMFANGNSYVWNETFHDIVLATFNNRIVPFRVRAYGSTVTVAPSSIDGDSNWEPAQQFQFVATDLVLSRQIRADEIYTDDLVVQNVLARNKAGEVTTTIDGETGKLTATEAEISGNLTATKGKIGGLSINGNSLTNEGFNNNAHIIMRNDINKVFCGIGGNVLPASSGVRAVGRFENKNDAGLYGSANIGIMATAQNANDNIAIMMGGGHITRLAVCVQVMTQSGTINPNTTCVLCTTKTDITITLPNMYSYDDGHTIAIRNMNDHIITIESSFGYQANGDYKRTYMHVDAGDNVISYQLRNRGAASTFVYARDINNGTQYGCWAQFKNPRDW